MKTERMKLTRDGENDEDSKNSVIGTLSVLFIPLRRGHPHLLSRVAWFNYHVTCRRTDKELESK